MSLDLRGKSTIADFMIVASGTSQRHISAIADKLCERLKKTGTFATTPEGDGNSGWVLIDAGDVIVHLFSEEMREFYDIEKLWSGGGVKRPSLASASA